MDEGVCQREQVSAEIRANRARQGVTVGLRYVLATGLGLVIVAFPIIYFLKI